jgi:hypothetical protein
VTLYERQKARKGTKSLFSFEPITDLQLARQFLAMIGYGCGQGAGEYFECRSGIMKDNTVLSFGGSWAEEESPQVFEMEFAPDESLIACGMVEVEYRYRGGADE